MDRILLLDIDGVVFHKRKKYFTQRLVDDFGVSEDDSKKFLIEALTPAIHGEVDMKQVLPDYIKSWGLDWSVDKLFNYWWSAENDVDQRMLEYIGNLKSKGIPVYLLTDQERYRGEYLASQLNKYVNGIFMSYQLRCKKASAEFFEKIKIALDLDNNHWVLFWDDDQKNVDIAQSCGIMAKYYTDFEIFVPETDKFFDL
jgi:FMN phosphatase YigB (HAD superfamily)